MITKKFLSDESGLTVALETILLFAISVLFLGMIFYSFQDMNQRQSKVLTEEELITIGNSIAKQMSDLTVEARASNTLGSHTTIISEFWIPYSIADNSYRVTLMPGKIILETTSSPYVSVEVPVNSDINLAENSSIYSNDGKYTLEYDSKSSAIYFSNGGVVPPPDFNAPTISIDSPDDGATVEKDTYINVTAWDDVGVTRVEYYVNGAYRYTAGSPFNWLWDTRGEIDGNYTVTAVAYDAAAHTKPASRNYTVYNPISDAPVITIISPPNQSTTDFKRPRIEAKITDDKAIDFSSIILLVDGINRTSNISYTMGNPKLTTVTYTPSQDMPVMRHYATLTVKDLNATPLSAIPAIWSFNVTDITDAAPPLATIIYPTGATLLSPGSPITVTYLAFDIADSGIENLTINVQRSDGLLYKYQENISIYPKVVYYIDPQETRTLGSNIYEGGYAYTYNVTVFDRSGKIGISSVIGPLTVLSGQAAQLYVDTSGNTTSSDGLILKNIRIKDNVSDSVTPKIDKITVAWSSNVTTEKIKNITFDGAIKWTGTSQSGTLLNVNPDYNTQGTLIPMDMGFNFDIGGRTFTIVFLLKDSTSRTVIFNVP